MRSLADASRAWDTVRRQASLQELKAHARGRDAAGRPAVTGLRSACWKAFLVLSSIDIAQWPAKLGQSRSGYVALKKRFFHGLQHQDEEDSMADPLSDDFQSPWTALRQDELARQEIFQDVERCMPENLYFRQPSTQNMLLDILFVWSKLNPAVGYRQGMHEVLAPIVWVVERDAIDPATNAGTDRDAADVRTVFDSEYIEHDAFELFNAVMTGLQSAYAPPSPVPGQQQPEPPIVPRANHIVRGLLHKADPLLAKHLADIDLAPQLFLMRWIRLLFGRELAFDDMLCVWDMIFAENASATIIDLVCLVMILRIRWQLIEAGYNEALTVVMRYPPLPPRQSGGSFVADAIRLRDNLTVDVGYQIIRKYTGREPPPVSRPGTPPFSPPLFDKLRTPSRFGSQARRTPVQSRQSSNLEGMLQNAARGVLSRGEQLNKAVKDAVGDFRENVQHLRHTRSDSQYSNADGLDWLAGGGRDLHAELEALHARNKNLAKMLESAANDLWKQHKETVGDNSAEDEQSKAFTMAIAKVQLAQVYLDDSTLPIPPDEEASEAAEPAELQHESTSPTKPKSEKPSSTTQDEHGKQHSQQSQQVDKTAPDGKAKLERPSLEQSSYSFMLGQDEPKPTGTRTSPFMSAGPFAADTNDSKEPRGLGFLFGESQGSSFIRRGSGQATQSNGRKKAPGKSEPEVMFDAESLSEVKLED